MSNYVDEFVSPDDPEPVSTLGDERQQVFFTGIAIGVLIGFVVAFLLFRGVALLHAL